jgi:PPOX class probable F420-dependent enzyme
VARLAFLDGDDRPRVLPVTFAIADDAVWSAIDRKPKRSGEPARVRWLRRRPEAALVIDVYDEDWSALAWMQLLGRVSVIELAQARSATDALTAKYPQYETEPPPGPLLRLTVERALHWKSTSNATSST